jgi:flagellar hook-length control protein FliK
MNNAANVINSPNLPVAERATANPGANSDGDQSQVRFAEVLRGQQTRNAENAKGPKDAGDAQGAGDPAADDPAGKQAAPADGAVPASAALPAPPPPTDPAIVALLLDPARAPAARTAPVTVGGFGSGLANGGRSAAATGESVSALPGPATDATTPLPDLAPGTKSLAAAMPLPANAAGGVRADPRPGAIASANNLDATRGDSAASRPQLPFGMAADSATRNETPAIDAGRTNPAAWAAFAVPVDGTLSRQTSATPLPPIEAPVGSPRFVDETAQQVTWLVKNGLSEAEIRVKPADMGPISVRIEMNQNEATISFAVTQPETRAAVQDSLHRLTEMLADSGISLGEANVGGQNFTQQPRDGGLSGRSRVTFAPGRGDNAIAGMPAGGRMIPERARGLVDTFA